MGDHCDVAFCFFLFVFFFFFYFFCFCFFFFQAEDGIRDTSVTGVQTCALPIFAVGKLRDLPSDDSAADMFELTQDMMRTADMPAYEVSNQIGRASCRERV